MEYLGARGKLIHERNLKTKISCQTPSQIYKFSDRFFHNCGHRDSVDCYYQVYPENVFLCCSREEVRWYLGGL
jgi:hypothetical protein